MQAGAAGAVFAAAPGCHPPPPPLPLPRLKLTSEEALVDCALAALHPPIQGHRLSRWHQHARACEAGGIRAPRRASDGWMAGWAGRWVQAQGAAASTPRPVGRPAGSTASLCCCSQRVDPESRAAGPTWREVLHRHALAAARQRSFLRPQVQHSSDRGAGLQRRAAGAGRRGR